MDRNEGATNFSEDIGQGLREPQRHHDSRMQQTCQPTSARPLAQGTKRDPRNLQPCLSNNAPDRQERGEVAGNFTGVSTDSDQECRQRYDDIQETGPPSVETKHVPNIANNTGLHIAKKKKKMMGEHTSYHQSIPREEAEERLKQFGKHCYLTRFSDLHDCYVLSVYQKQKPTDVMKHFKIIINDDGKNLIDGKEEDFDEIGQLLVYYENHRIDPALKTIGRNCIEEDYLRDEEKLRDEENKRQEREGQQARPRRPRRSVLQRLFKRNEQ